MLRIRPSAVWRHRSARGETRVNKNSGARSGGPGHDGLCQGAAQFLGEGNEEEGQKEKVRAD